MVRFPVDAFRVLVYIALASRLFALDPQQVFGITSPSTVLIQDVDSQGSGIVLSEQGLILTNFHVAVANIQLKVKACVRIGGKVVLREIENVKVLKVHPNYDLVLLQAEAPPNGVFIPAKFLPATAPVASGSRCFAIGNPGAANGEGSELTITEGLVSSASRDLDGQEYAQFSAAINPGNSGGPLCDEEGRVFGVVTWKMTETEGIAFAIPVRKVNLKEFIDLKERKPDGKLIDKAEHAANRYSEMASYSSGPQRQALLTLSAECYRIWMEADPTNADPYNNLSFVYQKLGQIDLARKYAAAGLKRDPSNSDSAHLLASMASADEKENPASNQRLIDTWFQAMAVASGPVNGTVHTEDIAAASINQKEYLAAAYALRWSEAFTPGPGFTPRREKLWKDLTAILPPAQLQEIRDRKDGFNRAEYDSLAAGKPLVPQSPHAFMVRPADRIAMDKLGKALGVLFERKRVPAPSEGLEIPLPDKPARVVMASAGWQVIASFPSLGKLGVFDAATGDLDGFIDFPEPEGKFATGGSLLIVYEPSTRDFKIYDLATLKLAAVKRSSIQGRIGFIGMGLLNPDHLFVLREVQGKNYPCYTPAEIHIPDFAWSEFETPIKNGMCPYYDMDSSRKDTPEGGMDESGSVCAVTLVGAPTARLNTYVLGLNHAVNFESIAISPAMPAVSPSGTYAVADFDMRPSFGGSNLYYGMDPTPNMFNCRMSFIAGHPAVLEHWTSERPNRVPAFRLRSLPSLDILSGISLPEPTVKRLIPRAPLAMPTMLASIYSDRIIYCLPEEKKILLFDLGLRGLPPGINATATPGKSFEKDLGLSGGYKVAITGGPEGLAYEERKRSLVWDVPADMKRGQTLKVTMTVTRPNYKNYPLVWNIFIQ